MKKPIQRLNSTGKAVGGMTTAFVPRDRVDGEALPRVINTQARGNIYKPAKHLNARSGLAICG